VTATVSERWQDAWLREHWDATPETIEYAFGRGLITLRQYLAATHEAWVAELDRKIIADAAATLTIDEALQIIAAR